MQNIGIRTDPVEIRRFKEVTDRTFSACVSRNFTRNKRDYCRSGEDSAPHPAPRFAGKEAAIKALSGLDIMHVFYPPVEILTDERGVPYVRINTDKTERLRIKISLSRSSHMALAFCIIIQESLYGIIR